MSEVSRREMLGAAALTAGLAPAVVSFRDDLAEPQRRRFLA